MKVAIIGSRHFDNYELLEKAVQESGFAITEECCGEAEGADTLGRIWAEVNLIPVTSFPADWDDTNAPGAVVKINSRGKCYNSRAGFNRNTEMINYADGVIALWDGKSPGTRHALREGKRLKKLIFVKQFMP